MLPHPLNRNNLRAVSCICTQAKISQHLWFPQFLLDSTNYHSWSLSIITTLNAKNKVEFILGNQPCPSKDNPNFSAWSRCNIMVASWLVYFISLPIRLSIIWMDVVIDIWNDLKTWCSKGDLSRISKTIILLLIILQNCALKIFQPNLICTCFIECSCCVKIIINQRKCKDCAMQFLRSLNDQYINILSHVLLMKLIPSIQKIISLIATLPLPSIHSNSRRKVKFFFTASMIFRYYLGLLFLYK